MHINKVIELGARKEPLGAQDLFEVSEDLNRHGLPKFAQRLVVSIAKIKRPVSFFFSLLGSIKHELVVTGINSALVTTTSVVYPILTRLFIQWLSETSPEEWKGWVLASGLFITLFFKALFFSSSTSIRGIAARTGRTTPSRQGLWTRTPMRKTASGPS